MKLVRGLVCSDADTGRHLRQQKVRDPSASCLSAAKQCGEDKPGDGGCTTIYGNLGFSHGGGVPAKYWAVCEVKMEVAWP